MKDEYTERTKQLREASKERRAKIRTKKIEDKREWDRRIKELRKMREEQGA